jgi:hypothetical protein
MGGTTESYPIQRSPSWGVQWSLPMDPSKNQHFSQINESKHQADIRLGVRETLGPPPLLEDTNRPPRRRSEQTSWKSAEASTKSIPERKPIFLVLSVKKRVTCKLLLAPNFVFLPRPYEKLVLHETTWFLYRLWRSPRYIFFNLFYQFKIYLK